MGRVIDIPREDIDPKQIATAIYEACHEQALSDVFNNQSTVVCLDRDAAVTALTEEYVNKKIEERLPHAMAGDPTSAAVVEELVKVEEKAKAAKAIYEMS